MVKIRKATVSDLPKLSGWLESSGGITFDLSRELVFVAEEGGEICGMLPVRFAIQLEPLLVNRKDFSRVTCSRAAVMLWRQAETWIAGPENRTGIKSYFAVTRSKAVKAWSERLGWKRIFKGAHTYVKHL